MNGDHLLIPIASRKQILRGINYEAGIPVLSLGPIGRQKLNLVNLVNL